MHDNFCFEVKSILFFFLSIFIYIYVNKKNEIKLLDSFIAFILSNLLIEKISFSFNHIF